MSSDQNSDNNRRASERKIFYSFGKLIFADQQPVDVRTLDLSTEGISIVCAINAKENTEWWLEIKLPINHKFEVFQIKGKVTNSIYSGESDGFRVGLVFLNASEKLKTALKETLATKKKI